MAAPTNTLVSATVKGAREDLENTIYLVAPEDTPFTKNIGAVKTSAVQHDWQVRSLATANANNAQLEGDDATIDAANLTTRLSATHQIFRKTGSVSGTTDALDLAGRAEELASQKLIKGQELKRDMEARFIGNYASKVDESGGTARTTAGALAWLTTNTNRGTNGTDGGFSNGVVSAATNGTKRDFTEAMLKDVLAQIYTNGGKVSQAYMGPLQKQVASTFTGVALNRVDNSKAGPITIVGAADVYVSDFGNVTFIPHAYGLTRDVLVIDPSMWAVGTLRPVQSFDLSKTGDSNKFEIVAEKCLISRNEKSSGVIADLN